MLGEAKARNRASYKKFQKVSQSRRSARKSNRRTGGRITKTHKVGTMSDKFYEKLKQAASLLAHSPESQKEVNWIYGQLASLNDQIEEIRRNGDGVEADKVAIYELERRQEALNPKP